VYTKKIDSVSEHHIVKTGRGIGLKFHMPLILALVKARNLL